KGEEEDIEDIEEFEEFQQNRISGIEPKKKIQLQPVIIVSSVAVLAIAAVLLITNYFYDKPEIFSPSKETTHLPGTDKKEIPDYKTINIHLEKGRKSYNKGYYNDAIAEFQEVVESDASDDDKAIALTYIGIIYDDRGDYDKAIEYYTRALRYDDKNITTYRNLSLAYKHKGDLEKAAGTIKKGLEIDANNVNNQILLGNIFYEQGNFTDAADQYEKALKLDSDNSTALYNLALTLFKKGDEVSGIEYLKRAGSADKIGEIAHLAYAKLGVIFTERKDYDLALKYLKLAVSINPKDPIDRYNLGIVYLKKGKTEKALQAFSMSEQLGKHDAELLENLGEAYYTLRDYDKSLDTYNRLLNINKRNIKILSRVAEIYYEKGELDKAYDLYKKITTLEPASENARIAYLNMGNILDDAQRYDEAIDIYKKALAINPKDDATLYNLGIAYKHSGKPELAIESWRKASELKPDEVKHHMAIADYYYDNKYYDSAVDEYTRIIRNWPDIQDAHFNLATIYYKKDLMDYSMEEYKKVIEINGKNEQARKAYINLGIIQSKAKKRDEDTMEKAHSFIQKALLMKPGDPEALYALGLVYNEMGMMDKAIETFYQAVSASRDTKLVAESYNYIGKCHYNEGRYKKALQAFTRGVETEPTFEEIRINRKVAMQAYERELERE
ncbi:MAG: tetratricopeptide repeat protein, partial [bacterium]|nr:tetratricopeptide repeat protein [bacterium]